jgi:hypothetical protein
VTKTIRDLSTLVGLIDRGHAIREANEAMADVLTTLNERSLDSPKKKFKGKVTIEVEFEVTNSIAMIAAKVKAKKPEPERGSSLYWLTGDGELTAEHPQQPDMFRPREAETA